FPGWPAGPAAPTPPGPPFVRGGEETGPPSGFPPLTKGGPGGVLSHARDAIRDHPEGTALGLEIPPLPARIHLDQEMREAFLADASDLFERIERIVVGLNSQDEPRAAIHELGRCLHTLKGAAGSVGLKELATLVHELEERLGQADNPVSQGLNDLLHQVVAYLDELIGLLRRGPDLAERTVAAPPPRPAP